MHYLGNHVMSAPNSPQDKSFDFFPLSKSLTAPELTAFSTPKSPKPKSAAPKSPPTSTTTATAARSHRAHSFNTYTTVPQSLNSDTPTSPEEPMADKLRTLQNLEALQARYVGTGHADTTKYEWLQNLSRDSYASYIGHPAMLSYMAVGMGEPKEKVRTMMIEKMVRGVGAPPEVS